MIKTGMYISDRYEIIDKVGSGGMADVYKALCHRLNRYVAIKILKPEYSIDASFVQKFRVLTVQKHHCSFVFHPAAHGVAS